MNIYRLLKIVNRIKSPRLQLLGLWGVHVLGKRYIGVFIDPILGCNYSCQMCYFSNPDVRREKRGRMTTEQLDAVAKSLFKRTLKLQIGCGAEPTLDIEGSVHLIESGKTYGVPYISLTTNGVLLTKETLSRMAAAGLNELTISLHGVHKDTYERLMGPTSKYEAFVELLQVIKEVKQSYSGLNVRINYTMNADNVDELVDFDTLFGDFPINQLQLRPIRKIGDSKYSNFDLSHVSESLETIIRPLSERCRQKGITVLFPEQIHIDHFARTEKGSYRSRLLSGFTYHYISKQSYNQSELRYGTEDYAQFAHRTHIGRQIWKSIWCSEQQCAIINKGLQNALNYDIR